MDFYRIFFKTFIMIGIGIILSGCFGETTIWVYNDTPDTISDINLTWGNKYYWGEQKSSLAEIQPGEYAKINIPTNPKGVPKNYGTGVDMSYVWKSEKYEYPGMIICLMPGDTSSWDFRLQGKTAKEYLRYALFGPGSPERTGIIRKSAEEEQEILRQHKAMWKNSDRMEVRKSWMEKITKDDGSYPNWDWVQKTSEPVILSAADRQKILDTLDTLVVPTRTDLDARTIKPYDIKIYAGEQLIDHLTLSGFDGILNVPGINTALRFPSREDGRRSACWKLFSKLFPTVNP